MIELGPNRHGKSAIRLVKVDRSGSSHRVRDLTVAISLDGEFGSAYTDGDNSVVIATDTMKNTVYALAGEHLTGSIEAFGFALGRHLLTTGPQVEAVNVRIQEHAWRRIGDAPDAFARDGSYTRTTRLRVDATGEDARPGIADLSVMKTGRSAFAGFPRDRFTTLQETDDRIMATKVTAEWLLDADRSIDYDASFEAVRSTFLEVFADHDSVSVQASIWIVGKAILERHPEIIEISMSLPNLHHFVVDLRPFGIENDREVFLATTEPHGLIEATVRRG
ncbi:MAG TPA: urate oxidase [Candidatus Limnocylindrales bacterium]